MSIHHFRSKITPMLDEYKKANSKGSHTVANTALINMIEFLISHIEQITPVYSSYTGGNGRGAYELNTTMVMTGAGLPVAAAAPAPNVGYTIAATQWNPPFQPPVGFGSDFPVGMTPLPKIDDLKESLEKLHDANYVIGLDYDSIKEHLNLTPEEREAQKNGVPADDKAVPVKRGRGRPKKGTK